MGANVGKSNNTNDGNNADQELGLPQNRNENRQQFQHQHQPIQQNALRNSYGNRSTDSNESIDSDARIKRALNMKVIDAEDDGLSKQYQFDIVNGKVTVKPFSTNDGESEFNSTTTDSNNNNNTTASTTNSTALNYTTKTRKSTTSSIFNRRSQAGNASTQSSAPTTSKKMYEVFSDDEDCEDDDDQIEESDLPKLSNYQKAGFFSRLSFSWLIPLMLRARHFLLRDEHLGLNDAEQADRCYHQYLNHWDLELKKQRPSLLRALFKAFWKEFLVAGLFKLVWGALVILAASYFVSGLVSYINGVNLGTVDDNGTRGWILSGFYFLDCFILSLALQQMLSRSSRVGIRVRASMITAIYRKSLIAQNISHDLGHVMTLISNDCSRLHDGCLKVHYVWSAIIESLTIIVVLFSQVGISAVIGIILTAVVVPLLYLVGLKVAELRRRQVIESGERVTVIHEILNAIKLVKFYSWEKPFGSNIHEIRKKEIELLQKAALYKTLHLMMVFAIPVVVLLGIFSVYTLWQNKFLNSSMAFTCLSLLNTLRFPLVVLPVALKSFGDAMGAVKRIETFLLQNEVRRSPLNTSIPKGIRCKNVDFGYILEDKSVRTTLRGLTMSVEPGEIVAICGGVGSGQSTLMKGIIGEAECLAGSFEVGGTTAYVPQASWIQHGTIRDNILFGKPLDEDKYKQVLFACCLERDLEILEFGDLTEIGEAGINLSGGQRQRISLARAVYSDADIYLLDSPLSAVDYFTCNHIFYYCFKQLLKEKTVVLITHTLHLLPECNKVVVCNDGRVCYSGAFDLNNIRPFFPTLDETVFTQHVKPQLDKKPGDVVLAHSINPQSQLSTDNLVEEDVPSKKVNKMSLFKIFVSWISFGSLTGFSLSLAIMMGTQIIRIFSDIFVRSWVTENVYYANHLNESSDGFRSDQVRLVVTYAIYVGAFMFFCLLRGWSFFSVTLKAAKGLHRKLFSSILRAPMSFFTVTPLGPLLNCFSRQQDQLDETLPDSIHMAGIYLCILGTSVGVIISVLPYFAICLVLLILLCFGLQRFTAALSQYLKQGVDTTNPKIFSHFAETLHGISVVRAFRAEDRFRDINLNLINKNHQMVYHMDQLNCWTAFYVDLVASLSVLGTCLLCIAFRNSITSASAGLAISNVLQMLVFLNMMVKSFNEARAETTAIQSTLHYIHNTQSEKKSSKVKLVYNDWPPKGKIRLHDIYMRYFPDSEDVLKGVSLTINPGEKNWYCWSNWKW